MELTNEKINYWQEDDDFVLNGFGIEYYPSDPSTSIEGEISVGLAIAKTLVDATHKNLLTSLDSDVVLTYFQFPEEIKTSCANNTLFILHSF